MTNFTEQQVEVEYLDTQKRELINIRRLPLGQFYLWVKELPNRNIPRLTEIAAQKPAGWADTITDESFVRLSKIAFEANFQRAIALSDQGEEFVAGAVLNEAVRTHLNMKNLETLGAEPINLSPPPLPSAAVGEIQKPSNAS